MKNTKCRWVWSVLLSTFILAPSTTLLAQPPALINYQGRLVQGTNLYNGMANVDFRIYTNAAGGSESFVSTGRVAVVDGLYTAVIGQHVTFGTLDASLDRSQAWLEVRVNGTTLTPRERILAVPYARAVHGMRVGSIYDIVMNPVGGGNESSGSWNVVGGGRFNRVFSFNSYNTLGGGFSNAIWSSLSGATLAGGEQNNLGSWHAVISGGRSNLIERDSHESVIGGGRGNRIMEGSFRATISGGLQNTVEGSSEGAMIPGGIGNIVNGFSSMAAGFRAKALHDGTFVWASNLIGDFESTANGQFLVRAHGGAGFNTTTPVAPLHVEGADPTTQFSGQLAISGVTASGVSNSGAGLRLIGHDGNIARDWGFIRALKSNSTVSNTQSHMSFGTRAQGGGLLERMRLDNTGLRVNGTVVSLSDREKKQDIVPVDPQEILDRLLAMPVHYWRYRDNPETLHVGPMAQDFHAAFGVGPDERHIASVDADGVSLAAIQALAAENVRLREELNEENARLRERLEALERKLGMEGQGPH